VDLIGLTSRHGNVSVYKYKTGWPTHFSPTQFWSDENESGWASPSRDSRLRLATWPANGRAGRQFWISFYFLDFCSWPWWL